MSYSMITGNVMSAAVLSVSLTPTSVGANTTAAQTFTVPGVKVGDYVAVDPPSTTTGILVGKARVSAADTVAISFANVTGGSLTPPVGTYVMFVARGGSAPAGFAP